MKLTFACPSCGKRLTADSSLAGRTGRCSTCSHRIVVPGGSPAAAGKASPADWQAAVSRQLAPPTKPGAAPAKRGAAAGGADPRPAPRTAAGYTLRPVTPVAVPKLDAPPPPRAAPRAERFAPPPEDDDDFEIVGPPISLPDAPPTPHGQSQLLIAYRRLCSKVALVTTWISETSYTLSFIMITLAVASGMVGRHSLAQWGTLAVILLNLVGLAGDVASLVTLSFRKGPLQGALFLVPPCTLYFLWSDWDRYRDTVDRMRIPLVTLAVVVAAYLFVPWLRGGTKGEGYLATTVNRTIGGVEKRFGRPQGVVDDVLRQARSWLREVHLPDPATLPGVPGTNRPAPGGRP